MSSCFRSDTFAQQVVVITGGATGIGRALADVFAELGARLVIASRNGENCAAAVRALEARGTEALAATVNVRDPESVAALFAAAHERFGRIDTLIANAGANFLCPAVEISPNGFRSVVETVLFGTFYCAQSAARLMMPAGRGRIIAMTATNGMNGSPLMAHSGVAKAGVINLMSTLAAEWGPFGITANCVSPGAVATEGASSRLWKDEGLAQAVARAAPLGRMAVPDDVVGACLFLASDAARFINGANIVVDGGELTRRIPASL